RLAAGPQVRARLFPARSTRAPLAITRWTADRRIVRPIERTMFAGRFRFRDGRTPTPFNSFVAIHALQQRPTAIRDAATDDAERAAFADGRPAAPVRLDARRAELPELRRRRLRRGARERAEVGAAG